MKTPEKYRDRIFKAVLRWHKRQGGTGRQERDAYEDLMVVIDDVIEKCSEPQRKQS